MLVCVHACGLFYIIVAMVMNTESGVLTCGLYQCLCFTKCVCVCVLCVCVCVCVCVCCVSVYMCICLCRVHMCIGICTLSPHGVLLMLRWSTLCIVNLLRKGLLALFTFQSVLS